MKYNLVHYNHFIVVIHRVASTMSKNQLNIGT